VVPILEFGKRILNRLEERVLALPAGTADLYIGDYPGVEKSVFPYFSVTPTNSKSATIRGAVISGQGIDFTVGHGTGGEIYIKNDGKVARTQENWFFKICDAVFTSWFSETLTFDAGGHVIRSALALQIDRRRVRLGGQHIFWWASRRKTMKTFDYEPYC
jgi:hypothetical protein